MNAKRVFPDLLTCGNLLSGCVSVFLATQGVFEWAFICILIGVLCDFFDGMVARALHVVSPIGVELDSLADVITSGLAPAMMVSCYLRPLIGWWGFLALIMAAFAALRLAKFNTDERQHTSFIGLATPSNAMFWGGIVSLPYAWISWEGIPWIILGMCAVSSYLMVSEIPFFALKFRNLSWNENKVAYVFLIGCVLLISVCIAEAIRYAMLSFALFAGTACIVWYVVYNLLILNIRRV